MEKRFRNFTINSIDQDNRVLFEIKDPDDSMVTYLNQEELKQLVEFLQKQIIKELYKVTYQITIDYKTSLKCPDAPYCNFSISDWEDMFDEEIIAKMDDYKHDHETTITILRDNKKLYG